MKTSETCRDKSLRRRAIRRHVDASGEPDLNGIDYVEIDEIDQTLIKVYFLGKAPENVQAVNVRIEGGTRIRNLRVESITLCRQLDPEEDDCMRVQVDRPGDFSIYTLRLVNASEGRPGDQPLDGFDPRYAQIDFSFKANCPSDLDCLPSNLCAPEPLDEPEANYLAKDYASFRQLILDRLALVMPDWQERHIPDLGIALVELLAYVGDHLSYYQDAVATEAYLDTARQRISVRRHATLVDYQMHEGCNARAWVYINTSDDQSLDDPSDIYFITGNGLSLATASRILTPEDLRNIPASLYEVFEPMGYQPRLPIALYEAHNEIPFYTWGDRECCLPRGATSATLKDEWVKAEIPPDKYPPEYPQQDELKESSYEEQQDEADLPTLRRRQQQPPWDDETPRKGPPPPQRQRKLRLAVGDVIIFEEVKGPRTGEAADADPSHRHAVRLTKAQPGVDTLFDVPVVEIEWAREDELPFPLCISAIGRAPQCAYLEDVSVARGNIILCDHGRTIKSDDWEVPAVSEEDAGCLGPAEPRETILRAGRFRPRLDKTPLTHCVPFPEPSFVARAQALYLARLMTSVRARVTEHWRRVRDRWPLTQEQFDELVTIFGRRRLDQVGLRPSDKKARLRQLIERQAAALKRLLDHDRTYLAQKARRVEVLRRRAQAGYLLTRQEKQEIAELFGDYFMPGIESAATLGPASIALQQSPRDALPAITVRRQRLLDEEEEEPSWSASDDDHDGQWTPQRNLLESRSPDRHFVAEIDGEGHAHLRFGDGELGRAPELNAVLRATYRVGNGNAGNVGAESISHLVFRKNRLSGVTFSVRNPLAAEGGADPEPVAEVKLFAPGAFRHELQRAIIADDYARLAERDRSATVQRAAASLRWAGSWYEMLVAIDPLATEEADPGLFGDIKESLHRYRRLGHDLAVSPARYVPLEIELIVCVLPNYLRGHVRAELLNVFGNRVLPNGKRGFFHPDNLTFGDDIYLSKLVAAAQAVEGVETVSVKKLQRFGEGPHREIENGVLPLSPLEVARVDNDPSFPERGKVVLDVRGGR